MEAALKQTLQVLRAAALVQAVACGLYVLAIIEACNQMLSTVKCRDRSSKLSVVSKDGMNCWGQTSMGLAAGPLSRVRTTFTHNFHAQSQFDIELVKVYSSVSTRVLQRC